MPYNFVADCFHTRKVCSRLSSHEVQLKRPFCVFEPPPPFGGLGPTYDDHLRLIEKRIVNFLLVLNVNFVR